MAQAVIDSQIKQNYSPPQKCPNGCARWKNLADDGNTQNQYQAEAVWLNGFIPDEAGNNCAQPIGFPGEGPWCYCKGTNDSSWGYCQAQQQAQPQQASTYIMTKGGYPQSGNAQNLSSFTNLSVEQAQQQCDALGDKCAGFSITADGSGNGAFKADTKGGIVYDSNYNGYAKSSQTFTTNQNDRDLQASVCKSTPNGLNSLNENISNCTSTTELKRNTNFAANTVKLQQDISALSATSMDSLMMGDTMFGQFGYNDIAKQVQARNADLKTTRTKLFKEVESNEAIIERSNRDFEDVKDTVPEPQAKKFVRFIEDYTLAILSISYLFMIIAVIYVYTVTSELKLIGFLKASVGSVLLTMFLFMMLFFLS